MSKLTDFIKLMTGHFDNKEQFDKMQTEGKTYPIKNLPENFNGTFVVEESYYKTDGKSHTSPHLFLISENNEEIVLSSYDIPNGEDKNTFSYDSMKAVDYSELNESKKFTPALYREKDGVWEGGSTSQFSPVMIFKLWERFSEDSLEVSEIIEVNGRRTFGYDDPIVYKRKIFVWLYLTTHHVIMFCKL